MNIAHVGPGASFPDEVNVIVENPAGGAPVKYELDKASGALIVDRFIHTAMHYPGHYGFVPGTLSGDGDPADVLVLAPLAVVPGCVLPARPVGVLVMEDDGGADEKIVAVVPSSVYPVYDAVRDAADLPPLVLQQIEHFFKHYKDLEKGKWSRVLRWDGAEVARDMLRAAQERAQQK
jgi:inorganic pyrophosphatase